MDFENFVKNMPPFTKYYMGGALVLALVSSF